MILCYTVLDSITLANRNQSSRAVSTPLCTRTSMFLSVCHHLRRGGGKYRTCNTFQILLVIAWTNRGFEYKCSGSSLNIFLGSKKPPLFLLPSLTARVKHLLVHGDQGGPPGPAHHVDTVAHEENQKSEQFLESVVITLIGLAFFLLFAFEIIILDWFLGNNI